MCLLIWWSRLSGGCSITRRRHQSPRRRCQCSTHWLSTKNMYAKAGKFGSVSVTELAHKAVRSPTRVQVAQMNSLNHYAQIVWLEQHVQLAKQIRLSTFILSTYQSAWNISSSCLWAMEALVIDFAHDYIFMAMWPEKLAQQVRSTVRAKITVKIQLLLKSDSIITVQTNKNS